MTGRRHATWTLWPLWVEKMAEKGDDLLHVFRRSFRPEKRWPTICLLAITGSWYSMRRGLKLRVLKLWFSPCLCIGRFKSSRFKILAVLFPVFLPPPLKAQCSHGNAWEGYPFCCPLCSQGHSVPYLATVTRTMAWFWYFQPSTSLWIRGSECFLGGGENGGAG